jgi:hypothetical protein
MRITPFASAIKNNLEHHGEFALTNFPVSDYLQAAA